MSDNHSFALKDALSKFANVSRLRDCAIPLLHTLDYKSQRTVDVGSVGEFLQTFDDGSLTEKQKSLFGCWEEVDILFQFTDDEVKRQMNLHSTNSFDGNQHKSFLFIGVDMSERNYSRTHLAGTARVVNRLFRMPVIVLFRYGSVLSLAAVHRQPNLRDGSLEVLGTVTLVKDINVQNPHRAHLDVLSNLAFSRMADSGVQDFDGLHDKWEQELDVELLNKKFYKKLFKWFERASKECKFPDDGAGTGGAERHVIRMITRLLFIWFLKEKELVPERLFSDSFAQAILKNHQPNNSNYYRAVLQNLFFATLNTEIEDRAFNTQSQQNDSDPRNFRYSNLLRDPVTFINELKQIPFVNGGLFDCLDDLNNQKCVDAFTENSTWSEELYVPSSLLLSKNDGLFALFRRFKFTIEESTPFDREVALDPELLGRVFENLLASYNPETRKSARNATGSYYTPRQVVDYMVHEALAESLSNKLTTVKDDVATWRDRIRRLFEHSDLTDDPTDHFNTQEKKSIVKAIANITTIDPAVGSGAFPMGILQTLTLALRRCDPDNSLWEEVQKDRAKEKASQAFDSMSQTSRDEELREISATFEKYRRSDYGRKLYLIQNAIYGVDIQAIACQIAKLRFFISLVIEQELDRSEPNLGIKPLPNLETRMVIANSLLELTTEKEFSILQDEIDQNLQEIVSVRERYFLADSRAQKIRCSRRDRELRRKLQDILKAGLCNYKAQQEQKIARNLKLATNEDEFEKFQELELTKSLLEIGQYESAYSAARDIAEWDPYDQNKQATWFSAEHMFGVTNGFDVVIGNPPYIQLQANQGREAKRYKNEGFETFGSTGDIYQLFYERGCTLLKPETGILSFITSNSWLKAEYGKPLRRYFSNFHTPLQLVEMGKDVFENAIVETAVLLVRKGQSLYEQGRAVVVQPTFDVPFPPPASHWETFEPAGDSPWIVLSPEERALMQKIEAVGTPLKDWDITIYYGIKTGFNDAFVIDTAVRDSLISADPTSEEIIKPVIRGRDIERYRANWAGLWMISTLPSLRLRIDNYPAIKQHLISYGKERLAQTGRHLSGGGRSRKQTSHSWFELQDTCAYHDKMSENKVVWIQLVPRVHHEVHVWH